MKTASAGYGQFRLRVSENTEDLSRWLTDLVARLRNPVPMWRRVGNISRSAFRRRFSEGGPGWTPLAPSTVASKNSKGQPPLNRYGKTPRRFRQDGASGGGTILIASGAYRDAAGQLGARGNVQRITGDGLFVGVNLTTPSGFPYPAVHETGGTGSYPITAKNGKPLRFFNSAGVMVSANKVEHPPLPQRKVFVLDRDDLVQVAVVAAEYAISEARTGDE